MTERSAPQPSRTGADIAPSAASDDAARFRRSRGEPLTYLLLTLGLGLCIALGLIGMQVYSGVSIDWTAIVVVGATTALLSLVFAGAWLYARSNRDARIVVDHAGILIPSLVADPIPWEDIAALRTSVMRGRHGRREQVYLVVHLKDPDAHVPVMNGLIRKLSQWWFGTPLVYGLEALEGDPEDVLDAIKERAPAELLESSALSP